MELPAGRLKHCKKVGELMFRLAQKKGWSAEKCEEMYQLGYMHDIGYAICTKSSDHAKVGAEMLKVQGFKYWKEVLYHGVPTTEYSSKELDLLNMADLSVDAQGNAVGVIDRLKDIASRYGNDSAVYKRAYILAKSLRMF